MLILHDASGFSLALGETQEPVVLPPFLHFGRAAASPDEVRSFRDRIQADGLDIVEWWDEPDYVSVKFTDPDGYVIEVGWDAANLPGEEHEFGQEVHGDEPEFSAKLGIEKRELEAGGLTQPPAAV